MRACAFGYIVDDGTEAVVADDVIGACAEREFGLLLAAGTVVATTMPPRRFTIWVSSSPTPPAAACTTATSPSRTGKVLVTR